MGNAITNTVTGAVKSVSKDGVLYNAITGRKERFISGCGSSGGGIAEEVFSQFREETEQNLTDLNGKVSGMDISKTESTTIPLLHNSVVKHSLTTDDVITVDVAGLTADKSVTMELWLTMPETVVSFSIPNVTWIEEPSFDTGNMLYCVVLRWDGAKVLANVAYSVEVG